MKQLQTKFIMVFATCYSNGERKSIDFEKAKDVSMPLQIHSGKYQTLIIESRQGNQQKIDN